MTVRIDLLAYWLIALLTTAASGQNFDRLLSPPHSAPTRSAQANAYRDGIRDAHRAVQSLRPNFDYRSLRDDVYRNYRAELGDTVRPVLPTRNLPPSRYQSSATDRFRIPSDFNRGPSAEQLREQARYERYREIQQKRDDLYRDEYYRGRPELDGCRDGSCDHGDRQTGFRPIQYNYASRGCDYGGGRNYGDFDYDWRRDVEARRFASALEAPYYGPAVPPRDFRTDRHVVDREGSYVRENLYGEPRVFNPDQPVRNLFRYVFP